MTRAKRASPRPANESSSSDPYCPHPRAQAARLKKGLGLQASRSDARSASLRVSGLAREHAESDADLLQRLLVFAAGVLTENQLGIGRAMQPAVMLDLGLELARRPAGIAERQDRALWSVPARDRLEDIERRGEADAFVDRQRRVLDEEIARMQHEAALGIDRPALEHLHAARAPRKLNNLR